MKSTFLTVTFFLLIRAALYAQVEEKLAPTDLKQQTVITEPATLHKGFLRAGLAGTYSIVDKYFTTDSKKESFANNIWAKTWFVQGLFQYGLTDRLQVEIDIPYKIGQVFQSLRYEMPINNIDSVVAWNVNGSGIGDLTFSAGYQLIMAAINRPSVSVYVDFTAPTGQKNPTNVVDERNYTLPQGSGEPSLDINLKMRRINFPYAYSGYITYNMFFGGSKIFYPGEEEKKFKSGNYLNVGGSFDFHLNDWIALQNGLDAYFYAKDEVSGVKDPENKWLIQYFPRLTFQIKRLRLAQAITVPLKGKSAGADVSYFLIVQYMF